MFRVRTALSLALSLTLPVVAAEAKTPGKSYCFNGICHTVKTLDETRRLVGVTTTVKASFYDDPKKDSYNPSNLTSSGEYFRAWKADNAASPIYPNGTKLLVWHPGTRKALTVRVNNAGPYWGDRKLDLSRAAAEALGMGGVATLQVRVIEAPTKAEATYSKGRTYAPVKGYMGQFASLDAASSGTSGATRLASNDAPVKSAATEASAKPATTVAVAKSTPSDAVSKPAAAIAPVKVAAVVPAPAPAKAVEAVKPAPKPAAAKIAAKIEPVSSPAPKSAKPAAPVRVAANETPAKPAKSRAKAERSRQQQAGTGETRACQGSRAHQPGRRATG